MILNANMRDMTFIAAEMREMDRREIMCQFPEHMTPNDVAMLLFDASCPDTRFVALDPKTQFPSMAFGAAPTTNPVLWGVWAFGTDRMIRAVPEATRFIKDEFMYYFAKVYKPLRVEVRTLQEHDLSHNWLRKLGAEYTAKLPKLGRNGETFDLYTWYPPEHAPSGQEQQIRVKAEGSF